MLTTDTALAGQYTATLGKAEAGYYIALEMNDFEIGGLHVSSLSFGAINHHERGTHLTTGLVLNYGDMLHLSLAASNDGSLREVDLGFQATAVDLETSYGFLDFELGIQDDQIAVAHTVHTKMWPAAISPEVLARTSSSGFLDAMLGEMKERDTGANAEVMRFRSEGQAKNSMR